jgi:hypothetical protein
VSFGIPFCSTCLVGTARPQWVFANVWLSELTLLPPAGFNGVAMGCSNILNNVDGYYDALVGTKSVHLLKKDRVLCSLVVDSRVTPIYIVNCLIWLC